MKIYDYIEFTSNPKKLDTLKKAAFNFIGKRMKGQVAWIIEGGTYAGQYAISIDPKKSLCEIFPEGTPSDEMFFWVPQEDCDDIVVLDRMTYLNE